ncbi:hypothetical protein BDR26DRAFT_620208 [Obelidium mucronatum]|nr:hypothetical protein BDR26DRAFT_620208 [Obelidium mucronatum]
MGSAVLYLLGFGIAAITADKSTSSLFSMAQCFLFVFAEEARLPLISLSALGVLPKVMGINRRITRKMKCTNLENSFKSRYFKESFGSLAVSRTETFSDNSFGCLTSSRSSTSRSKSVKSPNNLPYSVLSSSTRVSCKIRENGLRKRKVVSVL